jgi:hypothetical protein
MSLKNVDQYYDPSKLSSLKGQIISFLEKELGVKSTIDLNLSIVDRYRHPYEEATASAWTLGELNPNY